ncbi:FAD-binding oxidoreductase [Ensifer sp. YR511]|uniref:NAD(P)/FAD-dependent oxidoreductase n=1 Tax=Ensifer sp. YR511 TaxID=1855294 RepID=UPI000880EFAD|nr:FAD-dependent oxidoreductase [Ensifer sp. YR511]SDN42641.1 Glycine/D-amino acid oxidase [Ensifer sp. YR511]
MPSHTIDVAVIGGGMVGSAVALGLARLGRKVLVFDEGDAAIRAARANFGLVWVQGKGQGMPAYTTLTKRAAKQWLTFQRALFESTGIDVEHKLTGGLSFCVGQEEFETQSRRIEALHRADPQHEMKMIDRHELQKLLPRLPLGERVAGAVYGKEDGEANPLKLLHAMKIWMKLLGVEVLAGERVLAIEDNTASTRIVTETGHYQASMTVVAAGLGTTGLSKSIGMQVDIQPLRGHLVVTERAERILAVPAGGLRQAANGTFMIGSSSEHAGMNDSADPLACGPFLRRAMSIVPSLRRLEVVRIWAGLRTMTKDGNPVYDTTSTGRVHVVGCHSAVTLAPVHAGELAQALAEGAVRERYSPFRSGRFDAAA